MTDSDTLVERAENGDAESQYKLGLNYIYGTDVPKDASKAAEWFKKASDQGFLPARRELGILLAAGDGVEPDMETAVQYLSQAADELDPSALYHLGLMFEVGIGVEKDLQKAVRMLAYAAEMGYPGADTDAERIDKILYEERKKKLRARPLLNLQISDVDVEAACCKQMLDTLLDEEIVFIDSYKGPALLGEDKDGMDAVLDCCPFCGKKIEIIPRDTKF
jgi:TPR repeat protein